MYEVIKCWVTGDRAEKDDDESQLELDILMRELMELSRQRKFLGHKALEKDKGF